MRCCYEESSFPRVSLIVPFNLKMKKQPWLFNLLSTEADKIEVELFKKYPEEKAIKVVKKLRKLIKHVHCKSGKSIAIFVSPVAEKVCYFTPSQLEKYHF